MYGQKCQYNSPKVIVVLDPMQIRLIIQGFILKQKSLATQNLVGIILIIKTTVLKMD